MVQESLWRTGSMESSVHLHTLDGFTQPFFPRLSASILGSDFLNLAQVVTRVSPIKMGLICVSALWHVIRGRSELHCGFSIQMNGTRNAIGFWCRICGQLLCRVNPPIGTLIVTIRGRHRVSVPRLRNWRIKWSKQKNPGKILINLHFTKEKTQEKQNCGKFWREQFCRLRKVIAYFRGLSSLLWLLLFIILFILFVIFCFVTISPITTIISVLMWVECAVIWFLHAISPCYLPLLRLPLSLSCQCYNLLPSRFPSSFADQFWGTGIRRTSQLRKGYRIQVPPGRQSPSIIIIILQAPHLHRILM